MAETSDPTAVRRAGILEAAKGVFLRYGFKKTSMDDLARAAGLSRQGLYLYFATKEALFKEVVLYVLGATRAAGRAALGREDLPVEERLVGIFQALHGQAIGLPGAKHISELLETMVQLVGPLMEELEQDLVADVEQVLAGTGVAERWTEAGVSARDLAELLYSTSQGLKHRVSSPDAYRDRMRVAVRIICASAPALPDASAPR
jgi:AcrR family transcriptional regulator